MTRRVTDVSDQIAAEIREARMALGWNVPRLSAELAKHMCPRHPHGFFLSEKVLRCIEGSYRVRSITVDEAEVFGEVLGITFTFGTKRSN